ncbi:MAG: ATP synthase F0 subunit B [Thermoanaerobaculia bacterium]|nr:ATP synthase F0 subunit B [Thermoanaerobaculia bacterium]
MRRVLPALILSVPALSALASGGGEHGAQKLFLGLPYVVWQTANLVLFLGLLVFLLKKPVAEFFRTRRGEVEARLAKSEEDARKAREMADTLRARLTELEAELSTLRQAAERHAQDEEAEILKAAEEEARRIADRATLDIENRIRTARKELTLYAGGLALDLAREAVRRGLTPDDQLRLVEEGLAALETSIPGKAGQPN